MIWAHTRITTDKIRSVELLFREQAVSFDHARQMLLISVAEDRSMVRLWVCVPEIEMLTSYYGFSLCTRADLPLAPTLVAGCPEQFGRIFQG
ncbi:hypothetical protein B2G69_04355 [Methylorubrum zatmanii]|nr:hypothetical protein [Methylorubrum zatmanii]ARO53452.1 hypothetical protein B2G69_04355 [Methylorubrum zatmanii]